MEPLAYVLFAIAPVFYFRTWKHIGILVSEVNRDSPDDIPTPGYTQPLNHVRAGNGLDRSVGRFVSGRRVPGWLIRSMEQ